MEIELINGLVCVALDAASRLVLVVVGIPESSS